MLFNSLPFLIFFFAYYLVHRLFPFRYRVFLILAGSTIFYAYWKPAYVWLPWALILVCYGITSLVAAAPNPHRKKVRFIGGVIVLVLPLLFWKYTNFVWRSLSPLFPEASSEPLLKLSLPLGVSFITFTLISHLVDVYKGKLHPEKRFHFFSAAILFFPHLIAGPIVRPYQLVRQFDRGSFWLRSRTLLGALLFCWGLFKKMALADPLAVVVDRAYADAAISGGLDYLIAIYGFSFQIYFDFSGYTDMALGLGYLLGIRLPTNFNRPYLSRNLVEFWRRWHMTLSFWFRDYVYIPLGGNRGGAIFQVRNTIITMGLAGLWHGANWTFVVWGLLHGMGISLLHLRERFFPKRVFRFPGFASRVITFHFVTLGWIAFRAPDLSTMLRMIKGPFSSGWNLGSETLSTNAFILGILVLSPFLIRFDSQAHLRWIVQRLKKQYVLIILLALFALAVLLGAGNQSEFIYFEF